MATSRTRSGTGKAASRTRGAASAASETETKPNDLTDTRTEQLRALAADEPQPSEPETVTHPVAADEQPDADATVTDAPTTPQPDTESKRTGETASAKAAAQLGVPETDGIAGAAATAEVRDTDETAPKRDLAALRALADTSGSDPVTPYPADGIPAPNPALVLPPVRDTHTWLSDGDKPTTGRVLADGWRVKMHYGYRFARRGDRVTGPEDVMRKAASQGLVHIEE